MKLTIGMATYDDYDGVYFTVQALRLYHGRARDAEIIVVDNRPSGWCRPALEALGDWVPGYRYIPDGARRGTSVRDRIFAEASGDIVLCLDCHVLLVPGALERMLAHFERDGAARDMVQGPMLRDDLVAFETHFDPVWRNGMWGTWASDARGQDADAPAFDIPMQGLGLFAMRRVAWPGFNPHFRGFGGEEGYIHEKVRRQGGRTLCLPGLRWMHRYHRPFGVPYRNTWEDRVANYMIGHAELGWPLEPIAEHFRAHIGAEHGAELAERIVAQAIVAARSTADSPAPAAV